MSYHILRNGDVQVTLAIVYLELEADKIWQYRRRAGLCLDRWDSLTRLLLYYGETFEHS